MLGGSHVTSEREDWDRNSHGQRGHFAITQLSCCSTVGVDDEYEQHLGGILHFLRDVQGSNMFKKMHVFKQATLVRLFL